MPITADVLSIVKRDSIPNGVTSQLFRVLLPAGTIDGVKIDLEGANATNDVVFGFAIDGVAQYTTELTVTSGTNEITTTGLAEAVTNDQWATISIESPFTSGALTGVVAIGAHIIYETQTVNLTGAQTVAGVKTFSSDPLIPDEAYGAGWNGSLEPPTKNAVYDKIETISSGSVATDAIWDAAGDLAVGSGANTAVKLPMGTALQVLRVNAGATGLEYGTPAGGGTVDTANSPNANEYARFTDADTIEGRTEAEFKADMNLEIGVDVQAYDADLTTWAGITPGTSVGSQLALAADGSDTDAIGFRGIPQNAQTGNYTLVMADAGKHIYHASGAGAGDTYTIPANATVAYEIGTTITFINLDSNSVSIAITSDTMNLSPAGTTGSRTLAQYGVATAIKVTSTLWVISGSGLT